MNEPEFDPFADRPRSRCEDCAGPLVYDAAAVPLLLNLEPASTAAYMGWYGNGGTLYGCRRCGLVGLFSPVFQG